MHKNKYIFLFDICIENKIILLYNIGKVKNIQLITTKYIING